MKKVKLFVSCICHSRDQMLMMKIKGHGSHIFQIVALLNNLQILGQIDSVNFNSITMNVKIIIALIFILVT